MGLKGWEGSRGHPGKVEAFSTLSLLFIEEFKSKQIDFRACCRPEGEREAGDSGFRRTGEMRSPGHAVPWDELAGLACAFPRVPPCLWGMPLGLMETFRLVKARVAFFIEKRGCGG